MNNTDGILKDFLQEAGWSGTIKAGGAHKPEVSEALKNKLVDHLIRENKFNRIMVLTSTVMFCLIFLLGIYFALYYRDQPQTMELIFGGTFLTLLGVINALRKFWLEKCKMDLILTVVPNVPADQAAKLIETLLYGKPASKSKAKSL